MRRVYSAVGEAVDIGTVIDISRNGEYLGVGEIRHVLF
jgi:hypothetical protein